MSDNSINELLLLMGPFTLVRQTRKFGSDTLITISSQRTNERYSHYFSTVEDCKLKARIPLWVNGFVKRREALKVTQRRMTPNQ